MKKLLLAVFAVSALSLTGCGIFGCPSGEWQTVDDTCCPDAYPFYYSGTCWQINYSVSNPPPAGAEGQKPTEPEQKQAQ